MSYVVTISRDAPIKDDELRTVLKDFAELEISETAHSDDGALLEIRWQPNGDAEPSYFVFSDGKISAYTPSDEALVQLQALAKSLQAQVFGEEGENLTEIEVPDIPAAGCSPLVWTIAVAGVLLVAYWIAN